MSDKNSLVEIVIEDAETFRQLVHVHVEPRVFMLSLLGNGSLPCLIRSWPPIKSEKQKDLDKFLDELAEYYEPDNLTDLNMMIYNIIEARK